MKSIFTRSAEFFEKAEAAGLLSEIDQKLEQKQYLKRLAVLEKLKALPTLEQTEIPELTKALIAARREMEAADDRLRTATLNFNTLSMRVYGAEANHGTARTKLENEAMQESPEFLRNLHADLGFLDGLVSGCFKYQVEATGNWMSGPKTLTTNNAEAIQVCRTAIEKGRARAMAMMLEPTALDPQRAEAQSILTPVVQMAYDLGVPERQFVDRYSPLKAQHAAEDSVHKAAIKRRATIDAMR